MPRSPDDRHSEQLNDQADASSARRWRGRTSLNQVDTFLSDAQDALDQVENDPSLVAAGDSDDPFADVGKEATAIGLDQCAG